MQTFQKYFHSSSAPETPSHSRLVLGLSGGPRGSHEPGVALFSNDSLVLALQEERFNRVKNSISCFPTKSLKKLLAETGIDPREIDVVAHPGITYEDMITRWIQWLAANFDIRPRVQFAVHHQICHVHAAFWPSGFNDCLILSLDGVGDRCSGAIATAHEGQVSCHKFIEDPNRHSVGFFWALITNVIGYQHLEEAYKTMGLASLGKPRIDLNDALFFDLESGLPQLNSSFVTDKQRFISKHPEEPVFTSEFLQALSLEPRIPDSQIREIDKDLAASAQAHLEVVIKKFVNHWLERTNQHNLILTGGVALNSKLCGYLIKEAISTHIFAPQCPSDGNLALGAALCAVAETEKTMTATRRKVLQSVSASIPYDETAIHHAIHLSGYSHTKVDATELSNLLAKNHVVAFFLGRVGIRSESPGTEIHIG